MPENEVRQLLANVIGLQSDVAELMFRLGMERSIHEGEQSRRLHLAREAAASAMRELLEVENQLNPWM